LTQTQNDTVSMNGWLQVITGVEFSCTVATQGATLHYTPHLTNAAA